MFRPLPFRTRILAVVLAGGVIPLLVVGLWLNRRAVHSGEAVLRQRLGSALDQAAREVGISWIRERSELVTFSESPGLWRPGIPLPDSTPAALIHVTVVDSIGERAVPIRPSTEPGAILHLRFPAFDRASGRALGTLVLDLRAEALLGGLRNAGASVGAVMAAFDHEGSSLFTLPFDPALLSGDHFQWGGEEWLAARRNLEEPALSLVAAAPLTPFAAPFEAAARTGTVVLALVALASLLLATLLTTRLTRRLGHLAAAADAIAVGDLDQQVEPGAADEVGRVASAFNTMTENLRHTMAALALNESLAAVGEFASALAHEIRNPLSAIRLDLQRVEETLETDSAALTMQQRALLEVDRLERTVSGALRIARSGQITRTRIDLLTPLRAAMNAAVPEFTVHDANLEPLPDDYLRWPAVPVERFDSSPSAGAHPVTPMIVPVPGDAAALEQVFLNLLLNAAQALEPGGRAQVEVVRESGSVTVMVRDNGRGIPAESATKVFDLFYSTRSAGTGLGLPIARQIVLAHGGTIGIESSPGHGTVVRVSLPGAHAAGNLV